LKNHLPNGLQSAVRRLRWSILNTAFGQYSRERHRKLQEKERKKTRNQVNLKQHSRERYRKLQEEKERKKTRNEATWRIRRASIRVQSLIHFLSKYHSLGLI